MRGKDFLSQCIEYTYFYISNSITSDTFLLVSLILRFFLTGHSNPLIRNTIKLQYIGMKGH